MMNTTIVKLSETQLNWAVAFCEDIQNQKSNGIGGYCSSWAFGGPIIEREKMSVECYNGEWVAKHPSGIKMIGSTPLKAAMRAFIYVKFPIGINIPERI